MQAKKNKTQPCKASSPYTYLQKNSMKPSKIRENKLNENIELEIAVEIVTKI